MPSPVPPLPQASELAAHVVADPVSAAAVGRVWGSQIAFLLGRALQHVCSLAPHEVTATSTALDVPVQWHPSPGCRVALLSVDLHGSHFVNVTGRNVAIRKRANLAVTVPTGAGLVAFPDLMDGTIPLVQQDALRVARATYTTLVHLGDAGDVADQVHDLTVTVDDNGTETHRGIASITLVECPLGALQPEAGEPGVLLPWIDPRNDLHDGDSGIGAGLAAFLSGEQDARTKVRLHWQIATYEDTAYAWTRANVALGQIDWVGSVGTAATPKFRLRVRAPYGVSAGTPATFTIRVRYYSTASGTLRVKRSPVGAGVTSNHDMALASTGGAWAAASGTITLRADGTAQELDVEFEASTSDGSALYLSSIALIQTEVT